jgi:hypothetical protein
MVITRTFILRTLEGSATPFNPQSGTYPTIQGGEAPSRALQQVVFTAKNF